MMANRVTKILVGRRGATLITVLVFLMVITILMAMGLTVVTTTNNQKNSAHANSQAYYSAASITDTIVQYLRQDTVESNAIVPDTSANAVGVPASISQEIPKSQLPEKSASGDVGSAVVTITATKRDGTIGQNKLVEVKVSTTCTFSGSTETVSATMYRSEKGTLESGTLPDMGSPEFPKLAEHNKYAAELDAIVPAAGSDLVRVGLKYDSTNDEDKNIIDAAAITEDSNKEVLFQASNDDYATALGTALFPLPWGTGHKQDDRRLLVPANGRITINPLKNHEYWTASAPSATASAANNTKLNTFSVGGVPGYGVAGKDVKFRIAGNSATGNSLDDKKKYYYNILLMMDFPEQPDTILDSDVDYYENNMYTEAPLHLYHPIAWNSGTVFTQNTSDVVINRGLAQNVVIGPFAHKYDNFLDYWGWGEYTGNPWFGQNKGDFFKADPELNKDEADNRVGVPYLPEYYNDFHVYFLDNNDGDATILQGVNIFDGSIYSYRGLSLGSGLVKLNSSEGPMKNNINADVDGYDGINSNTYGHYWRYTLRWDQVIKNTDIVLVAHPGKTAKSFIRTPNSAADTTMVVDKETKKFSPKEKILGGTIYIGKGQTLTVERGVTGRPDRVIVDGGTLIIASSNAADSYNLESPVYVKNGGTMIMNDGAKINADVFVTGGGTFGVGSYNAGVFVGGGKATIDSDRGEYGGVMIYGSEGTGQEKNSDIVGAGYFGNLHASGNIEKVTVSGTSGKIHMIGDSFVDNITGDRSSDPFEGVSEASGNKVFCPDRNKDYKNLTEEGANRCLHYGAIKYSSRWTEPIWGGKK